MPSWPLWQVLAKYLGGLLWKYWRELLLVGVAIGGTIYLRSLWDAKEALERAKTRAEERAAVAEAMVQDHEVRRRHYVEQVSRLQDSVREADARWEQAVRNLRDAERRLRQSGPSVNVTGLGTSPWPGSSDTSKQQPGLCDPLIVACNARVAARDTIIQTLKGQARSDSTLIANLRKLIVTTPVVIPPIAPPVPPLSPPRWQRAIVTAATATVGAVIGQQVGGPRGQAISAAMGGAVGFWGMRP